jgi:alkyldihydroxyacetonephosphate synthase
MATPERMPWWGWGQHDQELPRGLLDLLRDELGVSGEIVSRPPALEDINIASSRANEEFLAALEGVVGKKHVRADRSERIGHARGRSYADLLALRSGKVLAPDAVVYPRDTSQVAAVLDICGQHACSVIPFGGGTSVVGGVNPDPQDSRVTVSLDLTLLAGVVDVDHDSLTATVKAGTRAIDFEEELNRHGLTLGHFPQSYEHATIGGFAAARSVGQASSGYGRFDQMVMGLRCATPQGEIVVKPYPSTAAGPPLLQLILGSEGTLGVITEVTVLVHRKPKQPHYEGWIFPTFVDGSQVFRKLAQSGVVPDVMRLSDEEESRVTMRTAQNEGATSAFGRMYLRAHGQSHGCVAIIGWDRAAHAQTARREAASRILGRGGGVPLGSGPGQAWLHGRFEAPYLRDALIDRGVLAETLETATTWTNLKNVWGKVRHALNSALAADGANAVIGAHASHVYPTGACLYFTVLAKQTDDPAAQWNNAKRAATDAILDSGATLTHHHGVGSEHAPWLEREVGYTAMETLIALKDHLDPAGIMNPGVLLRSP